MNLLDKVVKILEQPVCDHCLGRQFGQLLSGYDNAERGKMLRTLAAMSIDAEKAKTTMDISNFHDYKFHSLESAKVYDAKGVCQTTEKKVCSVCSGFFGNKDKWIKKIASKVGKYDFRTFLIGTKLSHEMASKEENLWERVGIDYCEPVKAEINREIGKAIEKGIKSAGKQTVKFDPKNPDVNIILDFNEDNVSILLNPLFVYGEYQKLVRGIPQTKWPSGKYKTSVEQIIAKPFMKAAKGKAHKLNGLGREDIDARCLAWRPFVLEILEPEKRDIDIKKLAKIIDKKKVVIRNARLSSIAEVRRLKESKADKSYRAIVACDSEITKSELKKLLSLANAEIRQRTPKRVLHRRSDRVRKKKVKSIKAKFINNKTFEFIVRGEAGLYIKELISSDDGRTKPSVSEILSKQCRCKELDVINIHVKN